MARTLITPSAPGGTPFPGPEPFAVDVCWRPARIAVLRPRGELDLATVPAFAARLDELLSYPPRGLVIDLAGLRFLAVRAISEFARLHRRATADPTLRVRLARATPAVTRLLRPSGVSPMFELYDTVQAALDSLGAPVDHDGPRTDR